MDGRLTDVDLVKALTAIQVAHRWTDQDVAERIGLTRPMWAMVKVGRARFGFKTLTRTFEAFPELREEVGAYLVETLQQQGAPVEVLGVPVRWLAPAPAPQEAAAA